MYQRANSFPNIHSYSITNSCTVRISNDECTDSSSNGLPVCVSDCFTHICANIAGRSSEGKLQFVIDIWMHLRRVLLFVLGG